MEELSFLLFTSLNNKISSYLNKKEGAHLRWCAIYEHIFRQFYAIVKNQIGLLRKTVKKKIIFFKGGGCNFIDILSYRYKILDRRPTRYEIMPRLFIFLLLNNLNLNILKNII